MKDTLEIKTKDETFELQFERASYHFYTLPKKLFFVVRMWKKLHEAQ